MIFIYKTTNIINNKIYIGIHKTAKLNDGYIGNGIKSEKYAIYLYNKYTTEKKSIPQFLLAVLKYGYKNFKREILKTFNSYKEALDYEANIVNKIFVKQNNNYNTIIGGTSHEHSEIQKFKIKNRMILNNPMKNPETVIKMLRNRNYTTSELTKQKLSIKAKIWCNTPEIKKIRSKNALGRNNSSFDSKFYKFMHISGEEFIGTCYDLIKIVGKGRSNFSKMKYIPNRFWNGWRRDFNYKCNNCGSYQRLSIGILK